MPWSSPYPAPCASPWPCPARRASPWRWPRPRWSSVSRPGPCPTLCAWPRAWQRLRRALHPGRALALHLGRCRARSGARYLGWCAGPREHATNRVHDRGKLQVLEGAIWPWSPTHEASPPGVVIDLVSTKVPRGVRSNAHRPYRAEFRTKRAGRHPSLVPQGQGSQNVCPGQTQEARHGGP